MENETEENPERKAPLSLTKSILYIIIISIVLSTISTMVFLKLPRGNYACTLIAPPSENMPLGGNMSLSEVNLSKFPNACDRILITGILQTASNESIILNTDGQDYYIALTNSTKFFPNPSGIGTANAGTVTEEAVAVSESTIAPPSETSETNYTPALPSINDFKIGSNISVVVNGFNKYNLVALEVIE